MTTEKKRGRNIMAFLQFEREHDPLGPRSLNEPLPFDQAIALSQVIKEKDPNMEHAFTPEVADKLS